MSLKNRIVGLATIGVAALAFAAPLASAKTATTMVTNAEVPAIAVGEGCSLPSSQVFAPWGDTAFYSLVQGGSFEAGTEGWSFAGGAKVVRDRNDGNAADGISDQYALELGKGASATSPEICVGTDSAYYRLFANAASTGSGASNLRVEVLFAGRVVKSSDVTAPTGTSVPTPRFAFVPTALDTLLASLELTSTVQIRVSSLDGATVRVDDVNMDPRMH